MLSYLWEIETGSVYRMLKDHDIFSGLGIESGKKRPVKTDCVESKTEDEQLRSEQDNQAVVGESESLARDETEKLKENYDKEPEHSAVQTTTIISEEQQMNDLAKDLMRADCIAETLDQVKVLSPSIFNECPSLDILQILKYLT